MAGLNYVYLKYSFSLKRLFSFFFTCLWIQKKAECFFFLSLHNETANFSFRYWEYYLSLLDFRFITSLFCHLFASHVVLLIKLSFMYSPAIFVCLQFDYFCVSVACGNGLLLTHPCLSIYAKNKCVFGCWLVVAIVCLIGVLVFNEWISFMLKITGRQL